MAEVQTERKEFRADVPFVKKATDDKGVLSLAGYASTWIKDRDNERVDPKAFDETLPAYLEKNPILLWQHDHDRPIGTVSGGSLDETGLEVDGNVPPPAQGEEGWAHTAYSKIGAGIVRTFSIGGMFERELRSPEGMDVYETELLDVVINKIELYEISVVSVPANPDSIFEAAAKAFTGAGSNGFTTPRGKQLEQVEQLLGLKRLTDPDLVTMTEDDQRKRFESLIKGWAEGLDFDAYRQVEAVHAEDPMKALAPLADLLQMVYVPQSNGLKAGRVLSKANEGRLLEAKKILDDVLEQVQKTPEQPLPGQTTIEQMEETV